jgi:hypothetical protein
MGLRQWDEEENFARDTRLHDLRNDAPPEGLNQPVFAANPNFLRGQLVPKKYLTWQLSVHAGTSRKAA